MEAQKCQIVIYIYIYIYKNLSLLCEVAGLAICNHGMPCH